MLKAIFATLVILAVTNSAALVPRNNQPAPGSGTQQFLINYNFETFPPTIRGSTPTPVTIVNDYDLLHFNTLLVNQTQPVVVGVPCHTAPTCTVFALNSGLLAGVLGGGQDPISLGPAYVTAAYQYSPISYFDPYAFYYGCVVADGSPDASIPVSCNITATGQSLSGKTVYSQVFQYNATGAVLQPMNLGLFNQGWYGLQIQTLYLTVSNNATTAALFDNLVATIFGPQKAAVTVDF